MAGPGPGIAESQLIFNLPAAKGTQNIDGPSIQAHAAFPSTLRGARRPRDRRPRARKTPYAERAKTRIRAETSGGKGTASDLDPP